MSCPHTETTAILAAFGEAPADYEVHLDGCADCQAAVDAHTETLGVLAPALPPTRRAAPARRWATGAAALLLAATALLAVRTITAPDDTQRLAVDSPVPHAQPLAELELSFESSLDSDLSDLELELALMTLE